MRSGLLPPSDVTEDEVLARVDGSLRRFFSFERFRIVHGGVSGGVAHCRSCLASGHMPEYLSTREFSIDVKFRPCLEWLVSEGRRPYGCPERCRRTNFSERA